MFHRARRSPALPAGSATQAGGGASDASEAGGLSGPAAKGSGRTVSLQPELDPHPAVPGRRTGTGTRGRGKAPLPYHPLHFIFKGCIGAEGHDVPVHNTPFPVDADDELHEPFDAPAAQSSRVKGFHVHVKVDCGAEEAAVPIDRDHGDPFGEEVQLGRSGTGRCRVRCSVSGPGWVVFRRGEEFGLRRKGGDMPRGREPALGLRCRRKAVEMRHRGRFGSRICREQRADGLVFWQGMGQVRYRWHEPLDDLLGRRCPTVGPWGVFPGRRKTCPGERRPGVGYPAFSCALICRPGQGNGRQRPGRLGGGGRGSRDRGHDGASCPVPGFGGQGRHPLRDGSDLIGLGGARSRRQHMNGIRGGRGPVRKGGRKRLAYRRPSERSRGGRRGRGEVVGGEAGAGHRFPRRGPQRVIGYGGPRGTALGKWPQGAIVKGRSCQEMFWTSGRFRFPMLRNGRCNRPIRSVDGRKDLLGRERGLELGSGPGGDTVGTSVVPGDGGLGGRRDPRKPHDGAHRVRRPGVRRGQARKKEQAGHMHHRRQSQRDAPSPVSPLHVRPPFPSCSRGRCDPRILSTSG